uniref:Uncharacterized protein n=1 Tax=Paulinella chromatophora TaxID=39717 RepID=B1X4X0_PAUCH|nr:hypothetical protein PCC_0558 [Paulinella chromatophora]ACB42989.1 hypothetical protein PCC_0558 [Paulinella chromatophora]
MDTTNKTYGLIVSNTAAAELVRQAAIAGTPGLMHIDLVEGGCEKFVIRLRSGHLSGVPIARVDGITLYAQISQLNDLAGLSIDYQDDLDGGSFRILPKRGMMCCACGSSFSWICSP